MSHNRLSGFLAMLMAVYIVPVSAGVAEDFDQLIAPIMKSVISPTDPGCAIGIARRGELLYQRGFGLANLDHDVPISSDTIFRVGSVSKQFVAASIALLALRGELDLDADVHTYIPELSAYKTPITVRHLISHSAGYPDVYEITDMLGHDEDGNFYPAELLFEIIYGMKRMNFEPGTQFEYSNAGYLLLARIVERISGQSMRDFAEQNIFNPLGMNHTHFHDNHREIVKNRAYGYRRDDTGEWEERNSLLNAVGDGGVFTTIGDLALWNNNFNKNQLDGKQAFLDLILTPYDYTEQGPQQNGKDLQYAFGVFLGEFGEEPAVFHSGGWAGFAAFLLRFPEQDKSLIILCNQATEETMAALPDIIKAVLSIPLN